MTVIVVNRNKTYAHSIRLVVWECPACGVVYGIPEHLADACKADGSRYYCPNGHSLGWDETDADRPSVGAALIGRSPMPADRPDGLDEAVRAFVAGLLAHADHPKVQVGPCVYCEPCGVRLYQGHDPNARPDDGPEPDYEDWLAWNTPTDDDLIPEPCPLCHATGACGYDDEGRALIHSLNTDEAAESAVEELARG